MSGARSRVVAVGGGCGHTPQSVPDTFIHLQVIHSMCLKHLVEKENGELVAGTFQEGRTPTARSSAASTSPFLDLQAAPACFPSGSPTSSHPAALSSRSSLASHTPIPPRNTRLIPLSALLPLALPSGDIRCRGQMGQELSFSIGRLPKVATARAAGSGFKSPPCLSRAVCPWASGGPSLGPEAPFRMHKI